MSIEINWNPIGHLGPIPINWYGLTMAIGFLGGGYLVWRRAPKCEVSHENVERLLIWIILGSIIGARVYYVIQNDFTLYLSAPWKIFAVWEGGLAFFGGLFGGTLGAYFYTRVHRLSFARVADLFAPAIPVGAAIGRISCGLAGMDYGTPTRLPWGVVYINPNSYAPLDGVPRHPDQYYELVGDLLIAAVLIKLQRKLSHGGMFLLYLLLFSVLRFFVFFVRGSVDPVAFGLKNAQLTAIAILMFTAPLLIRTVLKYRRDIKLR